MLASHFSSTSEFDNSNQARFSTSSTLLGEESQVLSTSSKCLLKNFIKGPVALGYVRMYNHVKIHIWSELMIYLNQLRILYEGQGTLEDITISSSIVCPKNITISNSII